MKLMKRFMSSIWKGWCVMNFKELVLLEDELLRELGTAELFRQVVERLEWDVIAEIYADISAELKNKKDGKKKWNLNLNLLKK